MTELYEVVHAIKVRGKDLQPGDRFAASDFAGNMAGLLRRWLEEGKVKLVTA